jgi:nitrogen fixation NifU-like protein
MFDDLADLYQQLILDHNNSPRNFRVLPDANRQAQGTNPICGDNYTLYAKMDGDVVEEISFQGSGCAISKASASLLTVRLKGKTKAEMKVLFDNVHDMILTGNIDGDVGNLAALAGVHKFPERTKCAILPWHAAMAAVEGRGETVSTETEKE